MIPNFYSMGCVHPTGELSCRDVGPTTPEHSCQPIFPHSKVQSVTSSNGTNFQQSTPSLIKQRFLSQIRIVSPYNPTNFNHVTLGPPPASPADLPRFSSPHESHWNSVAHWETNGTAISFVVRPEVKPNSSLHIDYALLQRIIDSAAEADKKEAALAMPPTPLSAPHIPEMPETAPLPSPTSDLTQAEPDQWQIASESSPIVINTFDDPEIYDSFPMPSAIHSDSLALSTCVPLTSVSLLTSFCQEPVINEHVSSAPLLTSYQARYRHGTARVDPGSSRFRQNQSLSSRRRVILTQLSPKSRKHCPWLVFAFQPCRMIIPKANQVVSNGIVCRSDPALLVTSPHVTCPLVYCLKSLVVSLVLPPSKSWLRPLLILIRSLRHDCLVTPQRVSARISFRRTVVYQRRHRVYVYLLRRPYPLVFKLAASSPKILLRTQKSLRPALYPYSRPSINHFRSSLLHYLRHVIQCSRFRSALCQSLCASLNRLRSSRFQYSHPRNSPFRLLNDLLRSLCQYFRLPPQHLRLRLQRLRPHHFRSQSSRPAMYLMFISPAMYTTPPRPRCCSLAM